MAARHAVLGIENGSFFYGTTRVFAGVSFLLDDARTALVGENGAGKSTLLKCLTGEFELNAGRVVKSRSLHLASVPQAIPAGLAKLTVRQVLDRALARSRSEGDWRIDILLDDLKITEAAAAARFDSLSGGWQRLLLIAAAARLEEPDILVLDEPTNHLDLAHLNLLEGWIADLATLPMLIVSHDREFLNRMTTRSIFLRTDGAHSFRFPFAQAREELLQRDATQAARRKLEDKEITRLSQMAARYRVWGVKNSDFHKREKATEKRIERIRDHQVAGPVQRERRLELHDAEIEAKVALRLQDLSVTVPDRSRVLFKIDRLVVGKGDKIALLGANGTGKSMLLGALAAVDRSDERPGPIRFNAACRLAYFDQRMAQLPLDQSVQGYIEAASGQATALLAKAGFDAARRKGPIESLSHGERARLSFLRLKLLQPNFYLLDEPTNHLDIEGQESLEAELDGSDVACLFISHDRWFTRAAANRFLEIRKGRLVEVDGPDAFFARGG